MTKTHKKIAALAMAAVMGVGGLGMAKLFQKATTASADTGKHSSYSLHASTGTIGINQSATVEVSSEAPATLALNNVDKGQYMIVAKVTDISGEYYWIDLSAVVNGNYTYLNESAALGAFIGTVTVESNSEIVLNTYSGATLTVEVWLQPLAIGQFNDYYLGDINISTDSKEILLDGISGNYTVIVDTYDYMAPSAVIMVNGMALTKNPDMYDAWTINLDLTGVSSLVLSTDNPTALSVNLSLRERITVTTPLPTTEASAAAFDIYETKDFYYFNFGQSGYYTIDFNSNVANAQFSYVVKTDPNNYTGTTVQGDNYPIYMEAYKQYYISVTYMGIPWELGEESPETANAWFTVSEWKAPTLTLNAEAVYVPVTAEDEKEVAMPMSVEAGTYDLNLINIPFDILFGGYTVTAHFGNKEVELNYGYAQITVDNETSIWFTTDYSEGFTAGATINTAEMKDFIYLNEWTEISIPANESRVYYIENLEEGYFNITLNNYGGASIVVESNMFTYPIISEGQTFGTFGVVTYGDPTATAVLYFYNNSDFTADLLAIVEPVNDVVMELGAETGIELASGVTKVYYLENLTDGLYSIALANAAGIEVTANGMPVTDGKFATNYDGESVALRFTNTGKETVVFTATVTMIANGLIEVGEEKYIFMTQDDVKTFMVEGLEAGTYTIKLSDYVTDVTVTMGNETIIAAGETTGTFTVKAAESVMLTIAYSGIDFLYFGVLVSANA